MRILKVYHGGRDPAHRQRERALAALGLEMTLVVPTAWPDPGGESILRQEPFQIIELPVHRSGDVNRHRHEDDAAVRRIFNTVRPDVLDIHEEPVSLVTRQWLSAAPAELPVALYTAQNIDKRFPPPFAQYERAALRRATTLYPCSKQAASVARGKGFSAHIEVLPLGYDPDTYQPGLQSVDDPLVTLGLVGRLVPEKGVLDAVHVLSAVRSEREAKLLIIGSGPESVGALTLAKDLQIAEYVELRPWSSAQTLSRIFQGMHVLLVPSRPTRTWVEQFGRVIVEAQASGAVTAGYASGAIPEVAGDAGLLVAEGDLAALIERTVQLLANPAEYQRRRHAGFVLAGERTWQEIAKRQHALYASMVEYPPTRSLPGRLAATAEFGEPAKIAGGGRPFALPILRNDTCMNRMLGAMIDRFHP